MLMSDDPEREIMRNSLVEEKERLKRAQQQLQNVLSSDENGGMSGVEEQIGGDMEMYDGPAVKPESPKSLTPRTPGMLKIQPIITRCFIFTNLRIDYRWPQAKTRTGAWRMSSTALTWHLGLLGDGLDSRLENIHAWPN